MSISNRGFTKVPRRLFKSLKTFSKLSQAEAKERAVILALYQIANHSRWQKFRCSNRYLSKRTGYSQGFCGAVIKRLNFKNALIITDPGDRDTAREIWISKPVKKWLAVPLAINALKTAALRAFALDLMLRAKESFDGEFAVSAEMYGVRHGVSSKQINRWLDRLSDLGFIATLKRGSRRGDRLIMCCKGQLKSHLPVSVPKAQRRKYRPAPKEKCPSTYPNNSSELKLNSRNSRLKFKKKKREREKKRRGIDPALYPLPSLQKLKDRWGLKAVIKALKEGLRDKGMSSSALAISKLYLVQRDGELHESFNPSLQCLPRISVPMFGTVLAKLLLKDHETASFTVEAF